MYCESELCVYNKNLSCNRDAIQLDTRGICYDYNAVSVPEEFLGYLKEKYSDKLEEMQKNSGLEE